MESITRRGFISSTAALAVTGKAAPRPETVRMGVIGVGPRGASLLRTLATLPGAKVSAICDIDQDRLNAALDIVQTATQAKPAGYSKGPTDYRNLLDRTDVDAVLIATPNAAHADMAVDALKARKHVLSEVPGALTIDDCRRLVGVVEESGVSYMLAENVCYYRTNMSVLNMVRQGLFGDLTYAECGYVHDTRTLQFTKDGKPTWRSERARQIGNRYPTHGIGPVAQWLGINRGDRFAKLVSLSSPSAGLPHFLSQRFGPDSVPARTKFAGDTTLTMLKTANGRLIELRFDPYSAKPHPSTTYHNLQGSTASYKDEENEQRIWLESRSKSFAWEPFEKYAGDYDHPLWKKWAADALKTGHRGADFMVLMDFVTALREGRPMPIDIYDSAAWSAIIPLSQRSVEQGGEPQAFPDFTSGRWRSRRA